MRPVISASGDAAGRGARCATNRWRRSPTWPDAEPTTRAAWLASVGRPRSQVPTYPVGLPLLMAAVRSHRRHRGRVPGPAACACSSRSGRPAMLADRIGGPLAAIVAAVWLATSPVALIEAMQPMSDVPVTAAWLAVLGGDRDHASPDGKPLGTRLDLRRRRRRGRGRNDPPEPRAAGRVPALYVLFAPDSPGLPVAERVRRAAWFSIPVVVAGILSPICSGVSSDRPWSRATAPRRHSIHARTSCPTLSSIPVGSSTRTDHGCWLRRSHAFVVRVRSMRWLLAFAALVVLAYLFYGRSRCGPICASCCRRSPSRWLPPARSPAALAACLRRSAAPRRWCWRCCWPPATSTRRKNTACSAGRATDARLWRAATSRPRRRHRGLRRGRAERRDALLHRALDRALGPVERRVARPRGRAVAWSRLRDLDRARRLGRGALSAKFSAARSARSTGRRAGSRHGSGRARGGSAIATRSCAAGSRTPIGCVVTLICRRPAATAPRRAVAFQGRQHLRLCQPRWTLPASVG